MIGLKIRPRFQVFVANFFLRLRPNGRNFTSGHIFNPNFENPMGCFLFDANFGGAYARIYTFLHEKRTL